MGRSTNNKEVRIIDLKDEKKIGEFVKVKITRVRPWSLEGISLQK